jgi:hypothetical protein
VIRARLILPILLNHDHTRVIGKWEAGGIGEFLPEFAVTPQQLLAIFGGAGIRILETDGTKQFVRRFEILEFSFCPTPAQETTQMVNEVRSGCAVRAAIQDETFMGSKVLADIAIERHRQIMAEGWTPEHDDEHKDGEIAVAAAMYAIPAHKRLLRNARTTPADAPPLWVPRQWPWEATGWKPKDARRDLIRAAALIVAEIERLDRVPR